MLNAKISWVSPHPQILSRTKSRSEQRAHLLPPSLLPLSQINFADAPDRYHLGYALIPIDTHIPILPIERYSGFTAHGTHTGQYIFSKDGDGLGELRTDVSEVAGGVLEKTWGRRDGKLLRDVCIQGNFEVREASFRR